LLQKHCYLLQKGHSFKEAFCHTSVLGQFVTCNLYIAKLCQVAELIKKKNLNPAAKTLIIQNV